MFFVSACNILLFILDKDELFIYLIFHNEKISLLSQFESHSILFKGDVLNIGAKYLFDKLSEAQIHQQENLLKDLI